MGMEEGILSLEIPPISLPEPLVQPACSESLGGLGWEAHGLSESRRMLGLP